MDNKFYVSYEAARLLKEKGYDIKRDFLTPIYKEDGSLYWSNHEDLSDKISAITKAEAIDWLESKGIYIELMFNFEPSIKYHEVLWCYSVYNKIERLGYKENYIFHTRLEAEEAAIIKALELLPIK